MGDIILIQKMTQSNLAMAIYRCGLLNYAGWWYFCYTQVCK